MIHNLHDFQTWPPQASCDPMQIMVTDLTPTLHLWHFSTQHSNQPARKQQRLNLTFFETPLQIFLKTRKILKKKG